MMFLNNSLSSNQITSIGGENLFDTFKKEKSTVITIDLDFNKLDDTCMASMGEYIQNNQFISNIYLRGNNISDKGIEILSHYLIGNTTLRLLGFGNNEKITNKSRDNLANIAKMSTITYIYLSDTSISESIQESIAKLLQIPVDKRAIPISSTAKSAAKAT